MKTDKASLKNSASTKSSSRWKIFWGKTEKAAIPPEQALMDLALQNIKLKSASEVGFRAVTYFRGEDFCAWILENKVTLREKFQNILSENALETVKDAENVGDILIRNKFIIRAQYKSLQGEAEDTDVSGKKPKWPKRLTLTRQNHFDANSFYVVEYEGSKSWQHMMLGVIVLCVLLLCLFPIWPIRVKMGLWYLSVAFVCVMLAIIIVRLIVFTLCWFFGWDVWVLPRLFADDLGVIDSFKPALTYVYRYDNWSMVAARGLLAFMTAVVLYKLSETHTLVDMTQAAQQGLIDVIEWGETKILNATIDTSTFARIDQKEANQKDLEEKVYMDSEFLHKLNESIPNYISDVKDFHCLVGCGFSRIEDLLDDCASECRCMKELVDARCVNDCTSTVRKDLQLLKSLTCNELNKTETEL